MKIYVALELKFHLHIKQVPEYSKEIICCRCCWCLSHISSAHTIPVHSNWKHLRLFLKAFLAQGSGSSKGQTEMPAVHVTGEQPRSMTDSTVDKYSSSFVLQFG